MLQTDEIITTKVVYVNEWFSHLMTCALALQSESWTNTRKHFCPFPKFIEGFVYVCRWHIAIITHICISIHMFVCFFGVDIHLNLKNELKIITKMDKNRISHRGGIHFVRELLWYHNKFFDQSLKKTIS